jgi:hypothetical protein
METEFWNVIMQLSDELESNSKVKVKEVTTPLRLNKKEKENLNGITPQSVFSFHQEMNGLYIEWEGKRVKDPDVKGLIKILSVKEILRDWKGVVYFDFTPDGDRIRKFHPIDFFIDEAAVGAFLNEENQEDPALYLYRFEGEPVNLHLDMSGYVHMLTAAKGFLYWQYTIIEILEGRENPVSRRFKEWMPKLFAEFNWDEYVTFFNELKIPV